MNLEDLSDEELMKLSSPPQEESSPSTGEVTNTENNTEPPTQESVEIPTEAPENQREGDVTVTTTDNSDDLPTQENISSGSEENTKQEQNTKSQEIDYKAKYEELMSSFKANGKNVELRSPEEARQLMQMGANFTKKMQEIAPYRKVIAMLTANNLLDEGKLSYLIDLDKKNPAAIQHLVKDANLDPLDIDTTAESKYAPNNYAVSDNEIQFKEYLDELTQDAEGQTTVQIFNNLDTESKAKLWEHPELMKIIHKQRESGLFDQICSEIDRLKTFGQLPPNVSFIEAYTRIGNEIQSKNPNQQAAPVAKRPAVMKPTVQNSEAARAASPTRVTKPTTSDVSRLVNLSDEDFMKQFAQYKNRN